MTAATVLRGDEMLKTLRLALVVIVIWSLVLQLIVGVVIPPVLAVGVVFAGLLLFLRPGRRWVGLVAGLFGLWSILGNLPSLLEELTHPSSALAFIMTLVAATAGLVLIIAGAGFFFGWTASPSVLLWSWAALILIGAGVALVAASGVEAVPAVDGDVVVVARANTYTPDRIELAAGGGGIWIDNRDGARHTFTIPELRVNLDVVGLKTQRVEIDAGNGEYAVLCTVVGHEGMTTTLVVG
jgi:plastocyanin